MKTEATAKIEPIKRTPSLTLLQRDIRDALITTEHVGCDIADAVTKLLERIEALERMAA